MRRSFIFALIIVLIFSASAFAQNFTYFSADIPAGYTANENSGGIVSIISDDNITARIIIAVMQKPENSTLYSLASKLFSDNITTSALGHDNAEGYYYFSMRDDGGLVFNIFIDDETSDDRINSGDYRVIIAAESVSNDVLDAVTGSYVSAPPDEMNYYNFGAYRVKLPEGYTANSTGLNVIIRADNDATAYIQIAIASKGGFTLEYLAEYYSRQIGGNNFVKNESGSYGFDFSSGDVVIHVTMEDSSSSSEISWGSYGVIAVSSTVPNEISSEIVNSFSRFVSRITSITIKNYLPQYNNGSPIIINDDNNDPTIIDNNNTSTTTNGDSNGGNSEPNIIIIYPERESGGLVDTIFSLASGGCNSGLGIFALVLSFCFFRKK